MYRVEIQLKDGKTEIYQNVKEAKCFGRFVLIEMQDRNLMIHDELISTVDIQRNKNE